MADIRMRQRTTAEQMSRAISLSDLWHALFERAKANGDDVDWALSKTVSALDTPPRWMKLRGNHYLLFLDEWGPAPDAEEKWSAILDECLRDAAIRMSH